MNPNIKRHLAALFLVLMIPLVILIVLSVWDILDPETISKSLWTLLVVGVFLALAVTILSFVDLEQKGGTKKKKRKYNDFYKDES